MHKGSSTKAVNIYDKDRLGREETSELISSIKSGAIFRLHCIFKNGVSASLSVDLPMINEKGEFKMNIKPFFGIPDSILNPEKASIFLNEKISLYNKNKPPEMPLFLASEEIVCPATPSFGINFTENPGTRFCEPSNILPFLTQKNSTLCMTVDRKGKIERSLHVDIVDCRICVYP